MKGWTDGRKGRRTDGWMEETTEGQTNPFMKMRENIKLPSPPSIPPIPTPTPPYPSWSHKSVVDEFELVSARG